MESRWLYRTAGAVGLASGFWLLGATGAQADEVETRDAQLLDAQILDGQLRDVFSPTAGLPAIGAVTADPAAPADLGQVRTTQIGLAQVDPPPGGGYARSGAPLPGDLPAGDLLGGDLLGGDLLGGDLLGGSPLGGGGLVGPTGSPDQLGGGRPATGAPAPSLDPLAGPVAGPQLPALIGEQLAAESGLTQLAPAPALGSLPLLGAA